MIIVPQADYPLGETIADMFCEEKDRAIAMLPHFPQGNDVPHIHCLYQRKTNERDVFQDYIADQIN